jgi:hypothetical protein
LHNSVPQQPLHDQQPEELSKIFDTAHLPGPCPCDALLAVRVYAGGVLEDGGHILGGEAVKVEMELAGRLAAESSGELARTLRLREWGPWPVLSSPTVTLRPG